jgi:tetratricopeptide (TPR) repeat protein
LAKRYADLDPSGGHAMLANYSFFTEKDQVRSEKELLESMKSPPIAGSEQAIHNTNLNTLNQMGYYYLGESDYENSYKYFSWAIRYGSDRVNPYDSMGDHFNAVARYDSALFYYQGALNINPNYPPSNFNKGQMLEKLGKTDLAIAAYQEFIKRIPENDYADRARDRLDDIQE